MTYPTYRENKPLDPMPWALFAASGIEIDRHADPRAASEFDPRAEYEQDGKKYPHYSGAYDERPYQEQVAIEYGAWETDDLEEHAFDLLAVVKYRRKVENF